MRNRLQRKNFLFSALICSLFLLPSGCFYALNLEQPYPLQIDPKDHQPVVLFPIPDAAGEAESGSNLYSFIRDTLVKKGYSLVSQAEVSEVLEEMKLTPLLLLSDRDALLQIGERLKAKLLIIGTIPEYKVQKAQLGAQTFQFWDQDPDRAPYEYVSLPTYTRGTSRIRLILRMFESEKGSLVWMEEGSIHAPSDAAEAYGQELAENLLKSLPPLSPLTAEKPK